MKTILATLLGISLLAPIADAAALASSERIAPTTIASSEYDFPAFGTQPWWDRQQDRG